MSDTRNLVDRSLVRELKRAAERLGWYCQPVGTDLEEEVPDMQATIGDRICIHGNCVGHPDKNGEIVEVHGAEGQPPYLVKFDDGQTRLMFPGPDAVIDHPASG